MSFTRWILHLVLQRYCEYNRHIVITVYSNNGQDVTGSYYHKCSSAWVGGVSGSFSAASRAMVGNVATMYTASPDTSVKMKASTEGQVGLSLQQKVCSSMYYLSPAIIWYCSLYYNQWLNDHYCQIYNIKERVSILQRTWILSKNAR